MNILLLAILFISPFSGGLIALFSSQYDVKKLKLFLSFAGGYLFSITLLSLMPQVYSNFDKISGVLILSGFFFQIFLEQYSKGIEHGHLHLHHIKKNIFPLGIILSMCLHTFMEGVPLGAMMTDTSNTKYSLLAGIALHEFPAAFALATILKSLNLNKNILYVLIVFYAISSPLGAAMSGYLNHNLTQDLFNYFMAFVVGTFLHISTTILFENSEQHHFSKIKLYAVLSGVLLALLAVFV